MILCLCRQISEDQFCRTVKQSCSGFDQVCRKTGAGGDCGSCLDEVKRLYHEVTKEKQAKSMIQDFQDSLKILEKSA